ncbi:Transposase IS3/IS911 [Candidatus Burkholderia pumila]|uniref:Transposase IS3/IS911 n=1 Tax=Candidatus Burkholderia pumila TaxID=1090375 RepID=A0ABR5HK22_9BURK|nr:Transposase IS3/IS911 [Candidatus Burkholderia pumila]
MTKNKDLKSRLVIGEKRDGRCEYDEGARDELIRMCLKPGVSIARTAMEHDVNPNQLRKWITRYHQQRMTQPQQNSASGITDGVPIDTPTPVRPSVASETPAFIPVVTAPLAPPAVPQGPSQSLPLMVDRTSCAIAEWRRI